jgi:hypothetical protein
MSHVGLLTVNICFAAAVAIRSHTFFPFGKLFSVRRNNNNISRIPTVTSEPFCKLSRNWPVLPCHLKSPSVHKCRYLAILKLIFQSLIRQREAVDQRLAALSSGQGQSFLARQRQARRMSHHQHFDSR